MPRTRRVPLITPLVEFLRTEAAGGAALLVATIAALVWVNVDAPSYADAWRHSAWINEGLMTVFFFVVGLEIKRELVAGELRDRRAAAMPAIAAAGGMLVPAVIYLAWNAGTAGGRGWAIPTATDIAFAVGVVTLLGSRVSPALKLFVLALAIVDDIGAIVVIALFYAHGVRGVWLLGAFAVVLVILGMRHLTARLLVYVPLAIALWLCVHASGVHATIAGVVLGFLVPIDARKEAGVRSAEALERTVHPFASFVVLPLFALANAGIPVSMHTVSHALGSRITWGIVTGLVVGKFVGIVGAVALASRLRIARLPAGMRWPDVAGAATVAGIGFTVSLFVVELSFAERSTLLEAKLGVLFASTLAALVAIGTNLGAARGRPRRLRSAG
jgi:NhaA family Na+:H+ antiporter